MRILALLFIFHGLAVSAQEYHPIIEDDKVWLEAAYVGTNMCLYDEIYQLRFGGDTLIGDHTYRKILKRTFNQISAGPYCPPFEASEEEELLSHFFMREDTAAQRVYLWHVDINDYPGGQEILMYDFTLEVGDTIPVSDYFTPGPPLVVSAVSEITLANGETRKYFETSGEPGAYIEGVGGESGLFQPLVEGIGFWWSVLCLKQDEEIIYSHSGSSSECNMMTAVDVIPAAAFNLYPNPNDGTFSFEIDHATGEPLQLVIFNAMGQQVYRHEISKTDYVDTGLPVGLYHWQVQASGAPVGAGKMVVY